jgi:hypothetical protein
MMAAQGIHLLAFRAVCDFRSIIINMAGVEPSLMQCVCVLRGPFAHEQG